MSVPRSAGLVGEAPPRVACARHRLYTVHGPERRGRELRPGSDKHLALRQGEAVVIRPATDPSQPAERHFKVTRGILEVLAR